MSDATITDLEAILGLDDEQRELFDETITEIAATSWSDPEAVYDACYQLGAAGYHADDVLEAIGPVIHFADGGLEDTRRAAIFASELLGIFNLDPNGLEAALTRASEILRKDPLTLKYLDQALVTAGPEAQAYGHSPGSLFEITAEMAARGHDRHGATHAIRDTYHELLEDSDDEDRPKS
jgi:hypothetical protein